MSDPTYPISKKIFNHRQSGPISSAADLLNELLNYYAQQIEDVNMPHMPTVGKAYEAITKRAFEADFVIPEGFDLRMVSGFISIGGERLPEQIDCMLVQGPGIEYGISGEFFYDIENVLCIFEVKKTLRKQDLSDSIQHLAKIRTKFSEHFNATMLENLSSWELDIAEKAFSTITGRTGPRNLEDALRFSRADKMLYSTLIKEILAPLTIIHGYGGYSTETGIRDALISVFEESPTSESGGKLGVESLPSLIISHSISITKHAPLFGAAATDDNRWVVLSSAFHEPMRLVLDCLWPKICLHCHAPMPITHDSENTNIAPLLVAQPFESDEKFGWSFEFLQLKTKHLRRPSLTPWQPFAVSCAEIGLLRMMQRNGGVIKLDFFLAVFMRNKFKQDVNDLTANLMKSRFFAKDGEKFSLTDPALYYIEEEGGTGYISTERDMFGDWCEKNGKPLNFEAICHIDRWPLDDFQKKVFERFLHITFKGLPAPKDADK